MKLPIKPKNKMSLIGEFMNSFLFKITFTLFAITPIHSYGNELSEKAIKKISNKCLAETDQLENKLNEMKERLDSMPENNEFAKEVFRAESCYDLAVGNSKRACKTFKDKLAEGKEAGHGAFCDYYSVFSLTKNEYQKAKQVIEEDKNLDTYGSTNVDGWIPGLKKMNSKFLSNKSIYRPSCDVGDVESGGLARNVYDEIVDALNNTKSFKPVKVWSHYACFTDDKADGIFDIAQGKGIQFFTNMNAKVELNSNVYCRDHLKTYCYPAFAFYHYCEQASSGAPDSEDEALKNRCKRDAKKAIKACGEGEYKAAMLPKDFAETKSLRDWYRKTSVEGEEPKFELIANVGMNNFNDNLERRAKPKEVTFEDTMFDMYSTCVILRKAAESQAGEDRRIVVGQKERSLSNTYECVRSAPWNVDFNYCSNASQFGDGIFDIGAAGLHTVMQVGSSLKDSKIQSNLAEDIASGDQTAHLKAQKSKVEREATLAKNRAHVNTAHATGLGTAVYNFPNAKQFSKACDTPLDGYFEDPALNCGVLWVADSNDEVKNQLFSNKAVRANMMYKMAQKVGQATFEYVMSNQLDNQADQLRDIQKEYDKFYAQDAVTPELVGVDYCEQNPKAPSCNGGGRTTIDNGGFSGFDSANFQNGQGGSFSFNKDSDPDFQGDQELTPEEKEAREKLADFMGKGGGKSFGSDFSSPGAASAKYGKSGGSGGGGGGGGGAGGGATAPAPQKPKQATNSQGVSKKNSKMISGSSNIKYRAGGSARKGKKDNNPFSNMLGNKRSRNVANTVNDIAPSQSKLFEKISNRYGKVSKEKRIYNFNGDENGI